MRRMAGMARNFTRELLDRRELIVSLSVRNFRAGYLGSVFGMTWIVVEPLIYLALLWFFFTKAMRFQPPAGYPYVPWLMTSMSLWNFISQTLAASAGTFRAHAFLLKRAEFNMSVLPVVNILTGVYVHGIFLVLLMALLLFSGIRPSWWWLQAAYYLLAASVLLLGLGWLAASLSLFVKDVGNVIGVLLQIGFWISPIFWSLETYPPQYRILLKINPVSYLLEGYRRSFLSGQPFWADPLGTAYFWAVALLGLAAGAVTYRRLRPHFGDMI